jgi:hypothetical protein
MSWRARHVNVPAPIPATGTWHSIQNKFAALDEKEEQLRERNVASPIPSRAFPLHSRIQWRLLPIQL